MGEKLNNGRTVISNKHLCRRRTLSATNDDNFENVAKLHEDDRRCTRGEKAYELDKSQRSAYHIMTERLQMRKIATRWDFHMLTETEKNNV